ncbi:MAG: hypothetical protein HOM80_01360, partial [Bacteroidetes bacterium]|nr:hypothetical protein [Bacteroidota bacterium]
MIKKANLLGALLLISSFVFAQTNFLSFNQNESLFNDKMPVRSVDEKDNNGLIVEYQFPGVFVSQIADNGMDFQNLHIKGFTNLKERGKPALPSHTDIIALPLGTENVSIKILSAEKQEYDNYMIYPSLRLATGRWGDPEPTFEIDQDFYNSNINYPNVPVDVVEINKIRGMNMAFVQLCPIQFNPAEGKIIVYSKIKYKIEFQKQSGFIDKRSSNNYLKTIPNFILNDYSIKNEIRQNDYTRALADQMRGESKSYIIITHSKYKQAADSLAQWKMQLGYGVEVISKSFWTADDVRNEIKTRYDSWDPKPDYFVIIGDNEDVPGDNILSPSNDEFHTDLYYACMDGLNDYMPDIAHGRISVSYAGEANLTIRKIID